VQTAAGNASPESRYLASNIALLLILLTAAYIRFTVAAGTEIVSPYRADAREYFFSAYNLDRYGVYSSQVTWPPEAHPVAPAADAETAPGYPLFLRLLGHPEPTVEYEHRIMFVQAMLSVLSVWLLYAIAVRFLRRSLACAAALFTAISPHQAVMSTYALTETLFGFLLLLSTLAALRAIESGRRWPFAIVGVLFGFCALIRPTALFIVPLACLAVYALRRLRPWRLHASILLLGFLLAMSPWWIRNATLPPARAETSKMLNFLLHGSYPDFTYDHNPESYGDPYRYDPRFPEYDRSLSTALAHIARNFRDDPTTQLRWYLIGKPGFFLSWTITKGAGDVFVYEPLTSPYFHDRFIDTTHRVSYWLHWPLMLFGMLGACLPWWRAERSGLSGGGLIAARCVSLVVLYAIGLHMIGAPYSRYSIPFRPLFYALAMLPLSAVWSRPMRRLHPRPEVNGPP
jgi:hypothetical protein